MEASLVAVRGQLTKAEEEVVGLSLELQRVRLGLSLQLSHSAEAAHQLDRQQRTEDLLQRELHAVRGATEATREKLLHQGSHKICY